MEQNNNSFERELLILFATSVEADRRLELHKETLPAPMFKVAKEVLYSTFVLESNKLCAFDEEKMLIAQKLVEEIDNNAELFFQKAGFTVSDAITFNDEEIVRQTIIKPYQPKEEDKQNAEN